ncbi:translocation/assembly module TamB domain-containing protein [Comamonas aquatica]|uniref:translocation/assembly module TamB domain-containing protein n=1 Tax=Comamonas aquatica TaxID=225991 RepID=UPI0005A66EE7|nr:translocation/assembly module TamB domain-containing protein [Comamonas aquatica]
MQERQEPTLAPASPPPAAAAPVPPRRRRRWLRRLLWTLALCLITLSSLLGLAWWWSGQSDSLARTLARVASWMPADQKLEADGIEGSLRHGGRIDWLRWTSPALQVEIKGADIAWRLQPLLQRELRFGKVNMDELRIRSTPQPEDDTPPTPLQSLLLPVRIDVPVRIERLVWEGPPETVVTELQGHYAYTGSHHTLKVSSLRYAQGFYEADLRLQAAAPMALHAELQGTVKAPLPQQDDQFLDITAKASVQGTLATEAARLEITAQASTATPAANQDADLAADIRATLQPWRPQPLEAAQVQLRHVDAALFLPSGPRTDLNGTLQAGPEGEGWQLQADLHNRLPGPWDRQALPVRALSADLRFDGLHTWLLQGARIDLGTTGERQLQAQARWDAQAQTVEGTVKLAGVNPADLYSTLEAAPITGTLQAQTDAAQRVQFALDLQSARARHPGALRLESARAQGSWQAPLLQLRDVQIQALQGLLQTRSLDIRTDTRHLQGQLELQVPGTRAQLALDASPDSGQGKLQLQITEAQQLGQWLSRLPLGRDPLAGASLQGQAQVELAWQGGWNKLQQRLLNPAAAQQASGLRLQGQVQARALRYTPEHGTASLLQQLQLSLSGTPENLQLQTEAQLQAGTQTLSLDTTLTAGLLQAQGAAPMDWQARIQALSVRWSPTGKADATWRAQLAAPLSASQRTTGNPVRTTRIQASEGRLAVTAPASAGAQNAHLTWSPVLLRQAGNGSWGLQSQGRLEGLPLAWVDALSPNPQQPLLAAAGIGGDLVVQGHWDIDSTGRALRADVVLERASGDIRLSVEDSEAAPVTVVRSSGASEVNPDSGQVQSRALLTSRGMRTRLQDLRLQIGAQGTDVRTQLTWNSERAGQLQADVRSQLRQTAAGLAWPETAPLSGTLKASMPNIGLWALFAPPGWRVSGSLNADVTLSGTRSAPQWSGVLSADQLSIRSLLDGVDLREGRLRAKLQGTRLDLTELFFKGGEGSSTRILGQSGNLTQAPKDGGTLTGSGFVEYDPQAGEGRSGMRMDIRAVAERLQVLIRADRQVSVSGNLQAAVQEGQVTLRGGLKVDRATIILADSSAPTLDDDVHVHSAASRKAAQEKAEQAARQAQAPGTVRAVRPPDIQVSIDLGNDFALQGYGITTRLEGQLQVANGPRITGEVHTVNGRYRAWGQALDVEKGTVRFSGPYANPAIDITAIRPNIAVRAGVKVTGSANRPLVTLFSEPDMSDAEKLSWVVMGRSAATNGAETAFLQQAALALLSGGNTGGNFAGQLGLDEVGFKGPSDDGTEGAAVTVGKRLSKDLYVAYEQSLSGAMGTLYIFYDLSRRLTLRGQTGVQTAVDLIYTRSKD